MSNNGENLYICLLAINMPSDKYLIMSSANFKIWSLTATLFMYYFYLYIRLLLGELVFQIMSCLLILLRNCFDEKNTAFNYGIEIITFFFSQGQYFCALVTNLYLLQVYEDIFLYFF